MSAKNMDNHNRWRNRTVAFRVSEEENAQIDLAVADNMYERSELDYLIYNAPLEYADLILNGDPERYLKAVTEYKLFEN